MSKDSHIKYRKKEAEEGWIQTRWARDNHKQTQKREGGNHDPQNNRKEDAVQKPQSEERNKYAILENDLVEIGLEEETVLGTEAPPPTSPRIEGKGSPGKGKHQETKFQPEPSDLTSEEVVWEEAEGEIGFSQLS